MLLDMKRGGMVWVHVSCRRARLLIRVFPSREGFAMLCKDYTNQVQQSTRHLWFSSQTHGKLSICHPNFRDCQVEAMASNLVISSAPFLCHLIGRSRQPHQYRRSVLVQEKILYYMSVQLMAGRSARGEFSCLANASLRTELSVACCMVAAMFLVSGRRFICYEGMHNFPEL